MGLETTCTASLNGETARGKALLETTELVFRGDFRARVPLAEIQDLKVEPEAVTVRWPGGTLTLVLGAAAARWAGKMRNPPSRLDKLGVKATSRVALVGPLEPAFVGEVSARAAARVVGAPRSPVDLIFYAATRPADLDRLPALAARLHPDGSLWVVRMKGPQAPVTESATRSAGLAAGLVDVKVAAFSATHTAEKFVLPLARRPPSASAARKPAATRVASQPAPLRPRGGSARGPRRTP